MCTDLQRLKRDPETGRNSTASSGVVTVPAARVAKLWKIALPALLVALLIAGGLYFRSHQRSKRLTEKDTVTLADFANSTGDAVFDDTLKTALSVSLNQSPFLNVLPENKTAATLKLMARPSLTFSVPSNSIRILPWPTLYWAPTMTLSLNKVGPASTTPRHSSCGNMRASGKTCLSPPSTIRM